MLLKEEGLVGTDGIHLRQGGKSILADKLANQEDVAVGVCYRPSDQKDAVEEAFFKQVAQVSRIQALTLVGTSMMLTS